MKRVGMRVNVEVQVAVSMSVVGEKLVILHKGNLEMRFNCRWWCLVEWKC